MILSLLYSTVTGNDLNSSYRRLSTLARLRKEKSIKEIHFFFENDEIPEYEYVVYMMFSNCIWISPCFQEKRHWPWWSRNASNERFMMFCLFLLNSGQENTSLLLRRYEMVSREKKWWWDVNNWNGLDMDKCLEIVVFAVVIPMKREQFYRKCVRSICLKKITFALHRQDYSDTKTVKWRYKESSNKDVAFVSSSVY